MLEGNAVEPGEVFDQRVARPRRQHGVAGIAQQLEQQRIGLARAGRQHDSVRGRPTGHDARSRPRPPAAQRAVRTAPARSRATGPAPSARAASLGYARPARVGFDRVRSITGSAGGAAPFDCTASRLRPAVCRRREENISGPVVARQTRPPGRPTHGTARGWPVSPRKTRASASSDPAGT